MKVLFISVLLVTAMIFSINYDLYAQSPQERSGDIVQWRENCSDPDPDIRLSYIEDAISKGDTTIQRVCVRCALESDSSDVRNLGIRAAISSKKQIVFSVEMPHDIQVAVQKAKSDAKALDAIYNTGIYKAYNAIRNGLVVVISDASVSSSSSVWYPILELPGKDENYKGDAVVDGDKIVWVGRIRAYSGYNSSINVKLEPGCKLKGTCKIGDYPLFTISADLL